MGGISMVSQRLIEENATWNEETGEWQLRCVAYTGNNMRKVTKEQPDSARKGDAVLAQMEATYRSYATDAEPDVLQSLLPLRAGISNSGVNPGSVHGDGNRPKTGRRKKKRQQPQM